MRRASRGLRTAWPWYAATAAGVGSLIAVLVLVPGGKATPSGLVATGPTVQPTAEPTPEQTVTATPSPSAAASPSSTAASRSPRTPKVSESSLLSSTYLERAFGSGRRALVQSALNPDGGYWERYPSACWADSGKKWPSTFERTWSWPDEVLVGETLATGTSAHDASAVLADCRHTGPNPPSLDPDALPEDSPSRDIDVGDEGYVTSRDHGLHHDVFGGARIGRAVVLVFWRQSGPVQSTAPVERMLRAAVAKALGGSEGVATSAPAQQTLPPLDGYLSYADVVAALHAPYLQASWFTDVRAARTGIACDAWRVAPLWDDAAVKAWLPTSDRPLTRAWISGGLDEWQYLDLTVGHATNASSASSDFAICRDRAGQFGGRPITDLGDEAFAVQGGWATSAAPNETAPGWVVMVRSGSTYLVVRTQNTAGDVERLARLAVDRYLAAHS